MSETAAAAPRRTSRILLLASLGLNLFFIGAVAALAWRYQHHPWHGPAYPTPAGRIEQLADSLPAADADKLRTAFRERMPAIEAARNTYRAARERLREGLRADPFNADAVRNAMADARAARSKLDEALQEVIITASAQMAPESRHILADWTPLRRRGKEKDR